MCRDSSRNQCILQFFVLSVLVFLMLIPAAGAAQGLDWSKKVQASDANSAPSLEPVMLLDERSDKYFIWMDSRDDNWEIYFSVFDRNDAPRITDLRITDAEDYSAFPTAVMDSRGDIHLVWRDNRDGSHDIYYAKLDRNGTRLLPDRRITHGGPDSTPHGAGHAPAIAIDGYDRVHVIFGDPVGEGTLQSPMESDLFYCSLDVRGNTLIPPTRVTFTPGESIYPDIVVSPGGQVHVVWQDNRDGRYSVFYMEMLSGSPRKVIKVSEEQSEGTRPAIDLDAEGRSCVVWGSSRNSALFGDDESGIYLTVIKPDGTRLIASKQVSECGAEPGSPDINVDGNGLLHIVWQDGRNANDDAEAAMVFILETVFNNLSRFIDFESVPMPLQSLIPGSYNSEIYYIRTDIYGNERCSEVRLTDDGESSVSPSVTMDGTGKVHVAWYESDSHGGEVFYRHRYRSADHGENFFIITTKSFTLMAGCAALALALYTLFGHTNLKYSLVGVFVPLYSTLRKESLLENSNRQELVRLVEQSPGMTFSELMKETGLKNGALAYHLGTLERTGFMKSVRDGKFRRFYMCGSKIREGSEIQERIVDIIRQNPCISQKDIAAMLCTSRQSVNYQVKKLARDKVIRLRREGRETRCEVNGCRPIP